MDAADSTKVSIFAFTVLLLPVSLHSVGLHILHIASKTTDFNRIHLILLSTLSATSICISVIISIKLTIVLFNVDPTVIFMLTLLSNVLLYTLYISLLSLIVVDRTLLFHYQVRYTAIWTTKKLKTSVVGIVVFSCTASLAFCIFFWNDKADIDHQLGIVYWPTLEYLFILLNIMAFSYIVFRKKTHRKTTSDNLRTVSATLSSIDIQRMQHEKNKRKTVFFLFIVSFLLLVFLPDQFYFVYTLRGAENSIYNYMISLAVFVTHLSSNAVLYLVTSKKLRRIWRRTYWSNITCLLMSKRNRGSSTVEPAIPPPPP